MTKQEFLNRLEQLLEDLPVEDKEDALCFYREYFEDAGEENEQAALAELGDVKELAKEIRSACQAAQPQIEPEQPYQPEQHRWPAPVQYVRPSSGTYQQQRRAEQRTEQPEQPKAEREQPKAEQADAAPVIRHTAPTRNGFASSIVMILIFLFSAPIWLGILGTIFGLFVAAAVMMFVGGLVGIIALFSITSIGISGLLVFGICLVVAGLGLLMMAGLTWLIATVCKPIIKFATKFVHNFMHTKTEE